MPLPRLDFMLGACPLARCADDFVRIADNSKQPPLSILSSGRCRTVTKGVAVLRRALILALAIVALGLSVAVPAAAVTLTEGGYADASSQSDLIALVNAYRAN